MARAATRYLGALEGVDQVVPNPGRLTALIRGKWGFNGILSDDNLKTREDHRHHAVDAAVIALTDRAVLNEVSRLTARGADDLVHLAVPELPAAIRDAIRTRVPGIVVAFKPDHGHGGRMFKETAYGFVKEGRHDPELGDYRLVTRKPLAGLTPKECGAIRDPDLRRQVAEWLRAARGRGEKHEQALAAFAKESGIARVRLLVVDQTVKPVASAPHKGYAPGSYVCCDIWRLPKGKPGRWRAKSFEWRGVFWSYAETTYGLPDKVAGKPHPAARFVTRLFKHDVVAYEEKGQTRIMRVAGFSTTNNKLDLKPNHAADAPRNYVSINVLGPMGLRRLHVTPDGRVRGLRQQRL
jgi:CRISPR-associated endonuclease Csn1